MSKLDIDCFSLFFGLWQLLRNTSVSLATEYYTVFTCSQHCLQFNAEQAVYYVFIPKIFCENS